MNDTLEVPFEVLPVRVPFQDGGHFWQSKVSTQKTILYCSGKYHHWRLIPQKGDFFSILGILPNLAVNSNKKTPIWFIWLINMFGEMKAGITPWITKEMPMLIVRQWFLSHVLIHEYYNLKIRMMKITTFLRCFFFVFF